MEYNIQGKPYPVLIANLQAGESITCQNGAMTWMSPNMQMTTSSGGFGKAIAKAFTGEAIFSNTYICFRPYAPVRIGTGTLYMTSSKHDRRTEDGNSF